MTNIISSTTHREHELQAKQLIMALTTWYTIYLLTYKKLPSSANNW